MKPTTKYFLLCLLCLALPLLSGCDAKVRVMVPHDASSEDSTTLAERFENWSGRSDIAKGYATALEKGDIKTLEAISTPEWVGIVGDFKLAVKQAQDAAAKRGGIKGSSAVDNGEVFLATVTFTNGEQLNFVFKNVDGAWKIDKVMDEQFDSNVSFLMEMVNRAKKK